MLLIFPEKSFRFKNLSKLSSKLYKKALGKTP